MTEEEIRKEFQRTDENSAKGRNVLAVNNFIKMLVAQTKSSNSDVRRAASNVMGLKYLNPNLDIFESNNPNSSDYISNFSIMEIGANSDLLETSHVFGHAIADSVSKMEDESNVYESIILGAQQYALSIEHKDYFKSYVYHLSKYNKKDKTEAELGPVSDIISAVFQRPGYRIGARENVCMLPTSHRRRYFYDFVNDRMKTDVIFEENFANFYALRANECEKEIQILKKLFGEEFVEVLDRKIQSYSEKMEEVAKLQGANPVDRNVLSAIKGVLTGVKKSDIKDIKLLEINYEQGLEVIK